MVGYSEAGGTASPSLRVGIDVGGTFTDLALEDASGRKLAITKVLSTTPNPADGVLEGFRLLMERSGRDARDISYLAHASTVASNLVLERSGPRIALITTMGFRDILLLQRQKRADLYDVNYNKPTPLVRRRDIYEISERMGPDGKTIRSVEGGEVRAVLERIVADGIVSLAVVFLHSYENPEHEQTVRSMIQQIAPGLHISLSSDVCPRWREYERSSTTTINAYVMPAVVAYLDSMQSTLEAEGLTRPIHLMQCSGGLARSDAVKQAPVALIESGPAAGALVAGVIGRLSGRDRVIAFDMGGTTAKVSLIENGEPYLVEDFEIAPVTKLSEGSGLPVSLPAVDLVEIGTGGGSIAHLDIGVLNVGPQSAGASPGPACYGFGGLRPTVTDADLVLGYLDPAYFLGGDVALDPSAARESIRTEIAEPLGLSVEAAALAIHAVANSSMANAVRITTVQKGVDPRDFVLVAFGGAGPLHVSSIARELGIPEVIVPANAGIASALGLLVARVKFEFARTLALPLVAASLATITDAFETLERRGHAALAESDASEGSAIARHVRVRYRGQGYEISVEMPAGTLDQSALESTQRRFYETYRRLYGFAEVGDLEVVDCRVTALGPSLESQMPRSAERPAERAKVGSRPAYFDNETGFVDSQVWSRYSIAEGQEVSGPAIVQERESTTLVPPGAHARMDSRGDLVIRFAGGGASNER